MKLYDRLAKNKELYAIDSKKNLDQLKDVLNKFNGRILDVGCGDLVSRYDFKIEGYVGIDIIRSNSISVIGDIHHLPFKSKCFDNCVCNNVLEHVNQPKRVLDEIYRVLKSGGALYVCVPFLEEKHSDPFDFQRFTDQGLKYIVSSAGFKIDYIRGNNGILNAMEYLLFGAIAWKIKEGSYKRLPQFIYTTALLFLFALIKFLNFCFRNIQRKDYHFATSFRLLAHKSKKYEIVPELIK